MNLTKANKILIDVANKYQNIKYEDISVSVPYFINSAEQAYKKVMLEVGIGQENINELIKVIRSGNTPLGSGGGKGSPEIITSDLERLLKHINKQGYYPKKPVHIRTWMTTMHIGLDCSGYIFNIIDSIQENLELNLLSKLKWQNPSEIRPSLAGVSVFDSEEFEQVTNYDELKPIDMLIPKDHLHIGILCELNNELMLTECSMGKNGITFSKVVKNNNDLKVENSDGWTSLFQNRNLIIRRIQSS